MVSSVAGLMTFSVRPLSASDHWPSMYMRFAVLVVVAVVIVFLPWGDGRGAALIVTTGGAGGTSPGPRRRRLRNSVRNSLCKPPTPRHNGGYGSPSSLTVLGSLAASRPAP